MGWQELDPELVKRLKMVEQPDYEGELLTTGDNILLIAAGIVFPLLLMVWGWPS